MSLYEAVKAWHCRWQGKDRLAPGWAMASAAQAGAMVRPCVSTNRRKRSGACIACTRMQHMCCMHVLHVSLACLGRSTGGTWMCVEWSTLSCRVG